MTRKRKIVDIRNFLGNRNVEIISVFEVCNTVNGRTEETKYSSFHLDQEVAKIESDFGLKLYVVSRVGIKIGEHIFLIGNCEKTIEITDPEKIRRKADEKSKDALYDR
jgi:hypothetical protein